jgi:hypothetical protein
MVRVSVSRMRSERSLTRVRSARRCLSVRASELGTAGALSSLDSPTDKTSAGCTSRSDGTPNRADYQEACRVDFAQPPLLSGRRAMD